jgi:hypothetical protein
MSLSSSELAPLASSPVSECAPPEPKGGGSPFLRLERKPNNLSTPLFRFEKDPEGPGRSQKFGIRNHMTEPEAGELDDSVVVQDDRLARQHRLTIHHHRSHTLPDNKYFNLVSKG